MQDTASYPLHSCQFPCYFSDSSVVKRCVTGWMIRDSIPGRGWDFSVHHLVHTGSGAHPASCSMGKVAR
jgi:hypothetical protein